MARRARLTSKPLIVRQTINNVTVSISISGSLVDKVVDSVQRPSIASSLDRESYQELLNDYLGTLAQICSSAFSTGDFAMMTLQLLYEQQEAARRYLITLLTVADAEVQLLREFRDREESAD